MPPFKYKAINDQGATVSGTIDAADPGEAQEKLVRQGLIPQQVSTSREVFGDLSGRINLFLARVRLTDLVIFTKQFRTLMKAGLPMGSLLDVLEEQTENLKLKRTAARMKKDIQEGGTLAEAFEKEPQIFSQLYCNMIRAGESSGRMVDVLDRLIYLMQHEHKVKSDIKSALRYPVIVVIALFAAFLFLLTFVIPQFVGIFEGAGIELPLPTRISLALYQWIVVYWPVSVGTVISLAAGLYIFLRTEKGQYVKDLVLLRIPVLGPVLLKAAMSRFASIFSILQASGVSVLNAMDVLTGTIGNKVISGEFQRIQAELRQGRGISGPLGQSRFFTPMVISMVATGEEAGNLDEMLSEVSIHYDDEVEYAVSRMSETLGPVLIAMLAGVVGFFALAIFLPMWDMVQTI
ncbi:Type II secretion system F domain protein [Desulfonatronospira thiodismutans ASO3-1]|uniref:Type II secretion system F domain protein n=1 Tax=Desulfonatronospira thiodismutans ASO3-1 TaxID=555779 RepID=D6SRQ3_9BACT|nr:MULTISPECIES: type II secretion system F family protein [Desulfonatronospira]EFI33369.1 Type II secretion system F domain protein [Desulfonatronospira thiodismutans ASO3-1]RQD76279.1 MAG: type II secretion system F family protein [Desulfonatronospira sp. MSAO_Bac3]